MKYNRNNKLRLFEICAGYGSQALALRRLREIYPEFDYELVGWAEYDPEDLITPNDPESHRPIDEQPAVIAHNALHPEGIGKNWGDITKIMCHANMSGVTMIFCCIILMYSGFNSKPMKFLL